MDLPCQSFIADCPTLVTDCPTLVKNGCLKLTSTAGTSLLRTTEQPSAVTPLFGGAVGMSPNLQSIPVKVLLFNVGLTFCAVLCNVVLPFYCFLLHLLCLLLACCAPVVFAWKSWPKLNRSKGFLNRDPRLILVIVD